MRLAKLKSQQRAIDFGGIKSKVALLVHDGANYRFAEAPLQGEHCVAAFCCHGGGIIAVRMHGSVELGGSNEHVRRLKNGDSIHIGLEKFDIEAKRSRLKLLLPASVLACAFAVFLIGKLGGQTEPVMPQPAAVQPVAAPVEVELPVKESETVLQGEILVKQAEDEFGLGEYKRAREKYLQAAELFENEEAKPVFYSKIEGGIRLSEEKLAENISPKLERAAGLIETGEQARIREAVVLLKGALLDWPGHARASELLEKSFSGLDRIALVPLMKADTLRQFSRCEEALVHYRSALAVAAFPEVSAYGRAKSGIEQCERGW